MSESVHNETTATKSGTPPHPLNRLLAHAGTIRSNANADARTAHRRHNLPPAFWDNGLDSECVADFLIAALER